MISLADYTEDISLFEPFDLIHNLISESEKEEIIDTLLEELAPAVSKLGIARANSINEKRKLLHAALNIIEPGYLTPAFITLLDKLLQSELHEKVIVDVQEIPAGKTVEETHISLFKGDITTLKIDAIVNAANSQLLGCFHPLHGCIDNAIHSNAGVQLRDDCDIIIKKQNTLEATGNAKITRAYNLPSSFVIHTVGPIISGRLNAHHETDLVKSYTSCLNICTEAEIIRSVAFCCISTGVFGYPQMEAANTAYKTVCQWLEENPNQLDKIVFNVFTENDLHIYNSLLS